MVRVGQVDDGKGVRQAASYLMVLTWFATVDQEDLGCMLDLSRAFACIGNEAGLSGSRGVMCLLGRPLTKQ